MVEGNVLTPRNHWLLSGVPPAVSQSVVAAGHEERFLGGDIIFREGEQSDGLYLVMAGAARVTATASNGDTLLAIVRANEVLGEMGVLDSEPRSGTATAASMCFVYFLPTEPFVDLLEQSSLVCMRLLSLLTRRLRVTNARLADLPAIGLITHHDVEMPS